jgi:hypothetical protein
MFAAAKLLLGCCSTRRAAAAATAGSAARHKTTRALAIDMLGGRACARCGRQRQHSTLKQGWWKVMVMASSSLGAGLAAEQRKKPSQQQG